LVLLLAALLGGARAERAAAEPTQEQDRQVKKAVEKGVAWLKKQRNSDGSFNPLDFDGKPQYELGMTALCGLALLAGGEDPDGPDMQAIYDYVKAREAIEKQGSRTTYSTACVIMFLTERYRPKKVDNRYARKNDCNLPKDVADWIQEMANWLASVQLEDGWWRYPHSPPGDLSNTQYALLGLRAARDCGAEVKLECFFRALEKTLSAQQADGPKVKRVEPARKPGEREYATDSGDKARGWPYQTTEGILVTGAMTTAAIAVIAIANDALKRPKRFEPYTTQIENKAKRSVQDGFGWLDHNWAVEYNPPRGAPAWHYYYLYGLERACEFGARPSIGRHDWFVEGAMYLVGQQKPDGRWSTGASIKEIVPNDLADTAWALLFLTRATRPLEPIKPPVVTGG
jgi:hypothetical protein